MRLPLAINAALAILALGLAFAAPGEGALRLGAASGSLQLSNSSEGRAVFTAVDMRPGGETRGTVQIGNTGSSAAALTVTRVAENETPGLGGGLLSEQLTLQLLDVSVPSSPVALYYGPLSAMPATAAGRLAPGQTRTFLFIATLPADGAGNAYQGAVLTSGFTWDATGNDAPVETPEPTTTPDPATTPVPTAPPVPTATPQPTAAPAEDAATGAVAADEVFNLPDARRCVSRRKFQIHLRRPRGFVLRSLVVTVNRRVKVRLHGANARRAKATLSLRGLPAGKVRVKIVATSTKGAKLVSKRTYRTCAKKTVSKKRKRAAKKRQRRSTPPSRS